MNKAPSLQTCEFFLFSFPLVRIRERTVETHEMTFAFDAEKQHATVHSPSLIQVWDYPSSCKHRCLTLCL